jgi:hypothetical protein
MDHSALYMMYHFADFFVFVFYTCFFCGYRHWELQEPIVREVEDAAKSFDIKMSATYAFEGEHKVATAQGIVRCHTNEVRVDNYVYTVN